MPLLPSCFTRFLTPIDTIALPEKFNYPFYYELHPLCIVAAKELQEYLQTQQDWIHNFGLDNTQTGLVIGKMFGVLVVQHQSGELGYLAAFSGKLAGSNHHKGFVPPVFDVLEEGGFFLEGEKELNQINRTIEQLEQDESFQQLQKNTEIKLAEIIHQIEEEKRKLREGKKDRKIRRETAKEELSDAEYLELCELLKEESLKQQYFAKKDLQVLQTKQEELAGELETYTNRIHHLKESRKEKSSALQQRIFEQYAFLNYNAESKNLADIFNYELKIAPPAGAGECAAPKLLQYAFQHHLKPISIAEFWWGQSPASEIRKHKDFYPACRGKCEPILKHMLKGLEVDENPMLVNPAEGKSVNMVYEDDFMCVINKPAEFLSVAGIHIKDSVYERMRAKFPDATGPLVVHRLDMSTSGLMLIAKNEEIYKKLQSQFIKRTVEKRYVALLDGEIVDDEGMIDLPLRVDLDDRPRQLVCYEYGKPARTKWRVITRKEGKTKVNFWPITGRTHQLRVHAAHVLGLGTPIVGDDIYGTKSQRLHLHAEWIKFKHPVSGKEISFCVEADF